MGGGRRGGDLTILEFLAPVSGTDYGVTEEDNERSDRTRSNSLGLTIIKALIDWTGIE